MAKKKLTITVDAELLEQLNLLGVDNISATVNDAIENLIAERRRRHALGQLIDRLIAEDGEPTAEEEAGADALLDEWDFGRLADASSPASA